MCGAWSDSPHFPAQAFSELRLWRAIPIHPVDEASASFRRQWPPHT